MTNHKFFLNAYWPIEPMQTVLVDECIQLGSWVRKPAEHIIYRRIIRYVGRHNKNVHRAALHRINNKLKVFKVASYIVTVVDGECIVSDSNGVVISV